MENTEEILLSPSVAPPIASTLDNDEHSLKEQEKLYNVRFKNDTKWRCRLSWWVIIVDSAWLLLVIVILFLNDLFLHLDNSVLITLLGTTTANVLGLAVIVLRGLFRNNDTLKSKKQ